MDRLNKVIMLIGIMILYTLSSCDHQPIKFIYLDEVLKNYSDSSQQQSDLISFLYLKSDLVDTINTMYPKLLTKRQRESGYFLIDERDKLKIGIEKEYINVEELVANLDDEIVALLQKKFGISNPKDNLSKRISIYKNTAFVEFFGLSSVHALTFDLKDGNQLTIGLAYIVVE